MRTLSVELGPKRHPVHVGAGILARLGALARDAGLSPGRCAMVTDSNVAPLYAREAERALRTAGFDPETIVVPAGEASKSLSMLGRVYDRMVEAELDRQSVLFALGGGVVGDLGGFAAATYLRGIALVQVPTTLVAQVDSSLGGKTGVNHPHAKNLIGAFHQPRLIVADVMALATLGEREFRQGMAEVIKYGAILDEPMIAALERDLNVILSRKADALEEIVERSLEHKARVVESDERESARRKLLNFGHTVGHALEAASAYANYLHGEAIAIGMAAACRLSAAYAGLSEADAKRLTALIQHAGLPVELPPGWRGGEFVRALRLDKKRQDQAVEFVLLDRLGHALTRKLGFDEIVAALS